MTPPKGRGLQGLLPALVLSTDQKFTYTDGGILNILK